MTVIEVDTPHGTGRLVLDQAAAPRAMVALGHGAGGGIEAFDLAALATALPPLGISVARFEQPWRTAGRRVAGAAAGLDAAWLTALGDLVSRRADLPLVVGGRSAGARVACRCYAPPARGVVALAFPLHPPGRPTASRVTELAGVAGPVLVVQGSRDPFGSAGELRAALAESRTGEPRDEDVPPGAADDPAANGAIEIVEIEGAVHALGPTRKADDPVARARAITDPVARFVLDLAGPTPPSGRHRVRPDPGSRPGRS
ncbi:alpha/beta family hydrolase [Raineyella sp. W15-4]|uniref:alpha/beta hydrolase family protein n=1 Tax=Raineyella sp. W15-4 TaxID=3081651 RepID=UPI002954D90D|nr:alpha/beta family hydrolase [Raineyella sp. W15-4]WOQ18610.1 alpha/beta family hydrolase [Raineyella sp. W15-4]